MALHNGTDVTTALAIVINAPEIEHIRKFNDRAWPRWPAHINLMFPFVAPAQLARVTEVLRATVAHIEPFKIQFDGLAAFKQGKQYSHHIALTDAALHKLYAAVRAALPDVPVKHSEFRPHITFGQGDADPSFRQQLKDTLRFDMVIDRISILRRTGDEPFAVVAELPLKKSAEPISVPQTIAETEEID